MVKCPDGAAAITQGSTALVLAGWFARGYSGCRLRRGWRLRAWGSSIDALSEYAALGASAAFRKCVSGLVRSFELCHWFGRQIRGLGAGENRGEFASQPGTTIINYGQVQMGSVTGVEGVGDQSGQRLSAESPPKQVEAPNATDATQLPFPEKLPSELLFAPHLEWESFYITQLLPGTGGLRRRVFENCRIHGPAILVPTNLGQIGGKTFVDCTWAENENAFYPPAPDGAHRQLTGVVALEDCSFRECYFVGVGVFISQEDYDRMIENYRLQREELQGEQDTEESEG